MSENGILLSSTLRKALRLKIDKGKLPIPESELADFGLFIEFYDTGHLFQFGRNDGWHLILEEDIKEGVARNEKGSGGTADYETYKDGTYEVYDAWSDNSGPVKEPFDAWVWGWINRLCKNAKERQAANEEAEATRKEIAKKGLRSVIKPVK